MTDRVSVQEKIPCVFRTAVLQRQSSKRHDQSYHVGALNEVTTKALEANVRKAVASEKVDGTCVYIQEFRGKPWLWARHDVKPNKQAERRFKKFQSAHQAWEVGDKVGPEPTFTWNVDKDLKKPPEHWETARGVQRIDGQLQPSASGHVPGWVPVLKDSRSHCWHLASTDLDKGVALLLQRKKDDCNKTLEVSTVRLEELLGQTLELVGTNVNANPYGLGSKKRPVHLLVPHGALKFYTPPPFDHEELADWFATPAGQVEGVVWYCDDGQLFKLHRHHLCLTWPVEEPSLTTLPVLITVDIGQYEWDFPESSQFYLFGRLKGQQFDSIRAVQWLDDN
ncbi:uncharacterized protein C12orf29 homolog [Branchiostoma floridae]|uniref:RNA ligase 1 n=1 Tax=Branchiostoma floridae TaxID=7739 RepID=A0A9J7L8Y6_BRAFL|nr:uncharacterized protein C12orf29 homolog [Branchiostoma floridae]